MAKRMTEDELMSAFGGIGEECSAWRGVMDVLDTAIETEVAAVAAPRLTSEARHENAGRLAAVMDVKSALEGLMKRATKDRDEE